MKDNNTNNNSKEINHQIGLILPTTDNIEESNDDIHIIKKIIRGKLFEL